MTARRSTLPPALATAALAAGLLACQPAAGPSAEELARTLVAGTAQAQAPTQTPTPSFTPEPTATEVPPSETPTATPTVTPTPGPVRFQDDFSADSGHWLDCRGCKWQSGTLLMGPYAPALKPETMLATCGPCGTPTYYAVSVDVTHFEGQTDRGYGLVYARTDQGFSIYEISPLYLITLAARYDLRLRSWELLNLNLDQLLTGLVRPGKATNRLELRVEPAGAGTANFFFRINGRTAFVFYSKPALPGQVGLGIDSHAVQIAFDNFELEELEP